MKKCFLAIWAMAVSGAYAIPCPTPTQHPEGAEVYPTCGNLGVFQKGGKYGFFDTQSGEVLAEAQFDEVKDRHVAAGVTPVRQKEKWAYVNSKGEAQTPYQYDYAEHFWYGPLAIARINGRYGMINGRFAAVVPFAYERMGKFLRPEGGEGYLAVACKDGQCGYLNDKGETAIALQYDDATAFAAAVTAVKKGDKWGYINAQGDIVQPFVYDKAEPFSLNWLGDRDVPCVAAERDGKRVVIDPQGKILPEDTQCPPLPPPPP
ncbi:MAG: WG repeat-containing protein [Cardiobacteriaceae bacterium]|nr:WG repeat-containing protein [Cardiobacteriaceae bacterium]